MWLTDVGGAIVLLVFCFDLTRVSGYELSLEPNDEKFVRPVGQSLLLTCNVDGSGPPNDRLAIVWKDPRGRLLTEQITQRIYYERESTTSSKLYITDIHPSDNGHYSCELQVNGARQVNKTVSLMAYKDITFDSAPNPQNPELHTNALIVCRVSAEPPPEVSWRFKNHRITANERYTLERDGLRIKNITQADNGEYVCQAAVPKKGGLATTKIAVQVYIRPTMTKMLKNEEAVQGTRLVMTCKANGLPSPKYEFRKNREPLVLADAHDGRILVDGDSGRLEFKQLHKRDQAEYTCVAINSVGDARSTASVRVLEPPEINELKNITMNENSSASLVCKSKGDPGPTMSFRRVGSSVDINATSHDRRVHVRRGTGVLTLEITRLTPDDAGNFTCTSNNSAGSDSKVGSITVNFRPRFHHHGDHNRKLYIWAGKTHNITCNVHAHPTPVITWFRHNHPLENNDTYHIFTSGHHSSLQVRVKEADQSWIYGLYVCKVRNTLGELVSNINLTRATVPGRPALSIKERTANTITLGAEPPVDNGGKEVIGYRVEYGRKIQDFAVGPFVVEFLRPGPTSTTASPRSASNVSAASKYTELMIENLKPRQRYTFYVRAKNEIGIGNTTEISVETEDYSKPYPIKVISGRYSHEATSYRMVWSNPKTGGKPIIRYNIKHRKTSTGNKPTPQEKWVDATVTDNGETPKVDYHFSGLSAQSVYEVEIDAENERGKSQPTKFLFNTARVSSVRSGVNRRSASSWWSLLAIGLALAASPSAAAAAASCWWTSLSRAG